MAITPVPSTTRRVHIYELCNRGRLESLLVLTAEDSRDLLPRMWRAPPPEVRLWRRQDDIAVEILAQHMTETAAEEFLTNYLEHMQRRTWRFRVWRA